jgi:hypothetical protein
MGQGNSGNSVGKVGGSSSIQDIANKYQLDTDPSHWSASDWKKLSPQERSQVLKDVEKELAKGDIDPQTAQQIESNAGATPGSSAASGSPSGPDDASQSDDASAKGAANDHSDGQ